MKTPQIIYELEYTSPIHRTLVGQLITGASFLWLSMWTYGFFKFGLLISAFFVLLPMLSEIFTNQIRGLILTEDAIQLKTGINRSDTLIPISEIKQVKLVERSRRRHSPRSEETIIGMKSYSDRSYSFRSNCVIQTKDGKYYEIANQYFPDGEFGLFLNNLKQIYEKQVSLTTTANPRRKIIDRQTNYGNTAQQKSTKPLDKLARLQHKNRIYLQEDQLLQNSLKSKLVEVFQSSYHQRDHTDITETNRKIVYSHNVAQDNTIYFIEDDYLPNLGSENIEMAENLISASFQNLEVVESRIKYYQKILNELDKIRFREDSKKTLNKIARDLQVLQDKNTSKSIEYSLTDVSTNDVDIEAKIIRDLENLTQVVREANDLDKSLELKEHISIFRETMSSNK